MFYISVVNQTEIGGVAAADLTAEAAVAVGVTSVTISRWASTGELPAVRLGPGERARYRIRRDDLEAFVRPADADREAHEARP